MKCPVQVYKIHVTINDSHIASHGGLVNPFKPSVLFVGHRQISADPDQTLQKAASGQGLHCLLTEC